MRWFTNNIAIKKNACTIQYFDKHYGRGFCVAILQNDKEKRTNNGLYRFSMLTEPPIYRTFSNIDIQKRNEIKSEKKKERRKQSIPRSRHSN